MSLTTPISNSGTALSPANGALYWENFIFLLITAGWVVTHWSDGTTLHVGGTPTAGWLVHTSAHVSIARPDGLFGFTLQRGTTNQLWRSKEARSAFNTGTPTATATGTAATEKIRVGAGTDASPTYTSIMATDGSYRQHTIADTTFPYYCHTIAPTSGTGVESGGTFIHEAVTGAPAADTAPWVTIIAQQVATLLSIGGSKISDDTYTAAKGWLGFATTPDLVSVAAMSFSMTIAQGAPNNLGSDSNDGSDPILKVAWGRRAALAAPTGPKYTSANLRWVGVSRGAMNPETHLVSGVPTIYRYQYGDMSLPSLAITAVL